MCVSLCDHFLSFSFLIPCVDQTEASQGEPQDQNEDTIMSRIGWHTWNTSSVAAAVTLLSSSRTMRRPVIHAAASMLLLLLVLVTCSDGFAIHKSAWRTPLRPSLIPTEPRTTITRESSPVVDSSRFGTRSSQDPAGSLWLSNRPGPSLSRLWMAADNEASGGTNKNNSNKNGKKRRYYRNKKKKTNNNNNNDNNGNNPEEVSKERKKEIVAQAAAELRKQRQKNKKKGNQKQSKSNNPATTANRKSRPGSSLAADSASTNDTAESDGTATQDSGLLDIVNPFKAGQKLRETLESIATIGTGLSDEQRSMYYLDDRLQQGLSLAERNPALERESNYVPEVLVVGATGEVGRLLVRQLLLQGKVRVRVLVRDLFSKTLNMLGTGVTYCQGDLSNIESLEYAVTDVDKIIFCAGAPRRDEDDFQGKFQDYMKETLKSSDANEGQDGDDTEEGVLSPAAAAEIEVDWEKAESELKVRSQLAEKVDLVGMQNLVRAFQNVRYADYGSSQTAKRSLFKFQSRPEDFSLFDIDEEDDEDAGDYPNYGGATDSDYLDEDEDDDDMLQLAEAYTADTVGAYTSDDDYVDEYADEYAEATSRSGAQTKSQCVWMKNKFDHAVFVGKVSKGIQGMGGEASVISSRLRSRDDPELGIDLGQGFGGFICRLCSDGGDYEAFVRTGLYEDEGIEYVCEFGTVTKSTTEENKSRNKFITKRLAFSNFQPVSKQKVSATRTDDGLAVPPFRGNDVRQIGFRYRADSNRDRFRFEKGGEYSNFYLALSYIKVYRSQPEPEFVYLSDARIPSTIQSSMINHDIRQIVPASSSSSLDTDNDGNEEGGATVELFDESKIKSATQDKGRSSEETYFKYRGEEILKSSGLNYAIIRVSEYNEDLSAEVSTVELKPVRVSPCVHVCVYMCTHTERHTHTCSGLVVVVVAVCSVTFVCFVCCFVLLN